MREKTAMARRCAAALALLLLAACAPGGPAPAALGTTAASAAPDLQATAAAQATAIVAQAQATALVLRAQAQATALVQAAGATPAGQAAAGQEAGTQNIPQATEAQPAPGKTPAPEEATAQGAGKTAGPEGTTAQAAASRSTATTAQATRARLPAGGVELLGVGMAADGAMIIVRFRSTPKITERWYQGTVSVQDEQTGALYNEIPVMPVIGPLFQRPRSVGDAGYVMLVNPPPGVRSGSVVTVILGDFRQGHVIVQP